MGTHGDRGQGRILPAPPCRQRGQRLPGHELSPPVPARGRAQRWEHTRVPMHTRALSHPSQRDPKHPPPQHPLSAAQAAQPHAQGPGAHACAHPQDATGPCTPGGTMHPSAHPSVPCTPSAHPAALCTPSAHPAAPCTPSVHTRQRRAPPLCTPSSAVHPSAHPVASCTRSHSRARRGLEKPSAVGLVEGIRRLPACHAALSVCW